MKKIKFLYLILSFIITFSLLSIGYYSYQYFYLTKPLNEYVNNNLDISSEDVIIDRKNKDIIISLNTNSLKKHYTNIDNIIDKYYNSNQYNIIFKDNRNEQLETNYNKISFDLYEAIETKQYTMFDDIIDKATIPNSINIEMDENYIYLNIKNGEHYLYELLPRHQMIG